MRTAPALMLGAALLLAQGCPSAYQRTYQKETEKLERADLAARSQAQAEHAEASRYAAVVYFEVGSARLNEDGQRELRWFVDKMQPYPQAVILVQGFADTTGSEAANRTLSEDRAQAVAATLAAQGVDRSRLTIQGYGTDSPARANVNAEGRSRNRRVEVTVR